MFEVTLISTVLFGIVFCAFYYFLISIITGRLVPINVRKLIFYISIFCAFGIAGEIVVNTIWTILFGGPLWEYRLYPTTSGHISYFFPLVWGSLGYYKYINDTVWHQFHPEQRFIPGIIMGAEAIFLELIYNGLFLLLFGSYIFYYFPSNLGPLSHLSCLEVLPFYFMVGLVLHSLIQRQNKIGYHYRLVSTVGFLWMVIAAILLV